MPIRARYPNANPETEGFGSDLIIEQTAWLPSVLPNNSDTLFTPNEPFKNNTVMDILKLMLLVYQVLVKILIHLLDIGVQVLHKVVVIRY